MDQRPSRPLLARLSARRPVVLGHRGSPRHAPENTLRSFRLARSEGADGVELDLRITRDRRWIVIHDHALDRTTDGRGPVALRSARSIRRLSAISPSASAGAREPVPFLEDVMAGLPADFLINLEIKVGAGTLDRSNAALARIVEADGGGRVWFSSFRADVLVRLRRSIPTVPLGLLGGTPETARRIGADLWHPRACDLTPDSARAAGRLGLRICVWDANDAAEINRVAGLGADAIITDDVPLARRILGPRGDGEPVNRDGMEEEDEGTSTAAFGAE